MPLIELSALLLLAAAMSFTPGPNTTLATALAANRGLRASLRFVIAVPVGWAALLLLCTAGLGAVVLAAPPLRWGIKAVGVGYLLWLAWRLVQSGQLGQADGQLSIGFWQGVALQFVNIKAWMLALTVVAGWIVGRSDGLQRLGLVLPVMMLFALASNLTYATLGALLRHWLAQGQRLLWFNRGMAAVLVLTALWMGSA